MVIWESCWFQFFALSLTFNYHKVSNENKKNHTKHKFDNNMHVVSEHSKYSSFFCLITSASAGVWLSGRPRERNSNSEEPAAIPSKWHRCMGHGLNSHPNDLWVR